MGSITVLSVKVRLVYPKFCRKIAFITIWCKSLCAICTEVIVEAIGESVGFITSDTFIAVVLSDPDGFILCIHCSWISLYLLCINMLVCRSSDQNVRLFQCMCLDIILLLILLNSRMKLRNRFSLYCSLNVFWTLDVSILQNILYCIFQTHPWLENFFYSKTTPSVDLIHWGF